MAGALGLSDVSEEDIDRKTGEKSKLETGNLKRSYNMPKACGDRLIKQGKSPEQAHKLCYPKGKPTGDVQSKIPPSSLGRVKAKSTKRSLLTKLNPLDKESRTRRKVKRHRRKKKKETGYEY